VQATRHVEGKRVDRVGFEQLLSFYSCFFRWVIKIILEKAGWGRGFKSSARSNSYYEGNTALN
jgi:hypothetical protein